MQQLYIGVGQEIRRQWRRQLPRGFGWQEEQQKFAKSDKRMQVQFHNMTELHLDARQWEQNS